MLWPRRIEAGRTLAQLLILAFFLLSLVVLVVASSLQLAAHFRSEKRALYNNQQLIAEGASRAVSGFIREKCRVLATAAWLTDPDTTSPEEWALVLQRLIGLERAFRRVAVFGPGNRTVAVVSRYSPAEPGRGTDDPGTVRFSQPADPGSGASISDVYIDPVTSEPLVSIRVPVVNGLREPRGTLTAELNLKFMWDLVDRLQVGSTGHAYVVDQAGRVLAFGDTARVLRGENVGHLPAVAAFVRNGTRPGSRSVEVYRGIEGSLVVGTYAPLFTPNWAVVTELPWLEAFREVVATALVSLAIIAAMALFAGASGKALSRNLTIPLVNLKETVTRIAEGERKLQARVEGPAEVAQLAAAFNSMSSQLQRSLEALEVQYAEAASARDALKTSEERLRLAQEGTRDGIWDWDVSEDRVFLSPQLQRMLGYEPAELVPSLPTLLSLLHPDDRQMAERELEKAVASNAPFAVECRMMAKDGGWRWVLPRGKAVSWDEHGKAVRLAGSLSDITERKVAEGERAALEAKLLQAQKMEAVALLAGGVAHDFNNMLSVILGHAELALRRLKPGDESRAAFEAIVTAGQRSANLTRQLLAFARQQTIAPRVLDLNETVSRILKLLLRITGENVDLVWKPGVNLWAVKMDPAQVDQLLANLIVNARDAIADVGKVTIETRNATFDPTFRSTDVGFAPGDYVMLAVSDSGCGMDKETLERIFDPFFTTKQMGKGTGLGLATVHGIVKQNRGFVNVYSEPGKGTTFRIYLPRHHAGHVSPGEVRRETPFPMGDETVLLVEDDRSLLDIGTAMLEQLGYTVLAANGPREALHRVRTHEGPIHLAITDVVMPEMSGRDLAARLGALHPAMKCLFVSGYTANVIAHQGVLEEGLHFLPKPFSLQELALKVREVLDESG